uniref:Uncharacterized protein AlNc14C14G1635 n=1 Tax=Albugo laibachii Nc14 TaxID=890382 RepID=F0W3Q0_9STRA|nr:conserved hypothetical protein [Albugo laibachii Nc14]|eukprot:CCA15720.1 conserved hypothetical protein [Albugo laibachii Nc14]
MKPETMNVEQVTCIFNTFRTFKASRGDKALCNQRKALQKGTLTIQGSAMTALNDWNLWQKRMLRAQKAELSIRSMTAGNSYNSAGDSVSELRTDTVQLRRDFDCFKRSLSPDIKRKELERWETVLQELERNQERNMNIYKSQLSSKSQRSNNRSSELLGLQKQIMRDQDDQLDIIGKGVANLKNFSMAVKDETDLHLRLLDDMDDDVLHAKDGLTTEGARAAQVARQSGNIKLYVAIVVLLIILIFLLVLGSGVNTFQADNWTYRCSKMGYLEVNHILNLGIGAMFGCEAPLLASVLLSLSATKKQCSVAIVEHDHSSPVVAISEGVADPNLRADITPRDQITYVN